MNTEQGNAGCGELRWFKSSHSGSDGGDCVEVAHGTSTGTVHVRDSKCTPGSAVSVSASQWAAFLTYAAGAADR